MDLPGKTKIGCTLAHGANTVWICCSDEDAAAVRQSFEDQEVVVVTIQSLLEKE